jgi:hypothetical protein
MSEIGILQQLASLELGRSVTFATLFPSEQQNRLDRLEHDQQIQTNRSVLDVEEIVLETFGC